MCKREKHSFGVSPLSVLKSLTVGILVSFIYSLECWKFLPVSVIIKNGDFLEFFLSFDFSPKKIHIFKI